MDKKQIAKKLVNRVITKKGVTYNPYQSAQADKLADIRLHGHNYFKKKHGEEEYKKFIKEKGNKIYY